MHSERIAATIRKAIADRNAQTAAERERIYAAARAAFEKRPAANDTGKAILEATILSVERAFAPASQTPPVAAARVSAARRYPHLALAALCGAIGAALITWAVMSTIPGSNSNAEILARQYDNTVSQLPAAMTFLREVSDAVVTMQKANRGKIEALASKDFIPLATFDAELAKRMPASLPAGSAIVLRADAFNFKILFNWTLCGAVRVSHPDMVDPLRGGADVLGCPFFGLWTPEAAGW